MPTRNVVLTEAQSKLVDSLVEGGRYQNASEAMREGLRLLEQREAAHAEMLARIMEGYEQAKRGEFAEGTGEEVIRRIMSENRKRA